LPVYGLAVLSLREFEYEYVLEFFDFEHGNAVYTQNSSTGAALLR
jgi:hypothetical protein